MMASFYLSKGTWGLNGFTDMKTWALGVDLGVKYPDIVWFMVRLGPFTVSLTKVWV